MLPTTLQTSEPGGFKDEDYYIFCMYFYGLKPRTSWGGAIWGPETFIKNTT